MRHRADRPAARTTAVRSGVRVTASRAGQCTTIAGLALTGALLAGCGGWSFAGGTVGATPQPSTSSATGIASSPSHPASRPHISAADGLSRDATAAPQHTSGDLSVSTPKPVSGFRDSGPGAGSNAPPARRAKDAPSQRITFAPTSITLGSGRQSASTSVLATDTGRDGLMVIPADAGDVGWWRSGSLAGDRYGTVVLAGHIDSAQYGLGYFARLLKLKVGDAVTLRDQRYRQAYRVSKVYEVAKTVLSAHTGTFSHSVPGRLVLVTCTGTFNRATGHYNDNLVVLATPVGKAVRATS